MRIRLHRQSCSRKPMSRPAFRLSGGTSRSSPDTDTYDENAEAVSLMTVHSAKGLEFPYVPPRVLVEAVPRAGRAANRERKERRLAYVAITRAKGADHPVHQKPRHLRADGVHAPRFLDEIPDDLLEKETARPPRRHQPAGAGHRAPQFDRQRAPERCPSRSAAGSCIPFSGRASSSRREDMGNDTLLEVEFFSGRRKADAKLRKKAEINAKRGRNNGGNQTHSGTSV